MSRNHCPFSAEQVKAFSLLKDEGPEKTLAYIKHARSLAHDPQRSDSHDLLSAEQLVAISALCGCPEDVLRYWLHNLQVPGTESTSASTRPRGASKSPRPYSCTVCGSQRSYQNHYDWKKHEKEHEYTYVCMVAGPWNPVAKGFQCPHCEMLNPDEEHFILHSVVRCSSQHKRRDLMVQHLNAEHMVRDISLVSLVSTWRRDHGRRFWACGFCVTLFSNIPERLQHIKKEHYDQNQNIVEWDVTRVIKGLLLQPGLVAAWRILLHTKGCQDASQLTWQPWKIGDLQYQLEVGPTVERSAESLAETAYLASQKSSISNERLSVSSERQYKASGTMPDHYSQPFNDDVFDESCMIDQQAGIGLWPPTPMFGDSNSQSTLSSGLDSQFCPLVGHQALVAGPEVVHEGDWTLDPRLLSVPELPEHNDLMSVRHSG